MKNLLSLWLRLSHGRMIFAVLLLAIFSVACERQATTVVPQSQLPTLSAYPIATTGVTTAASSAATLVASTPVTGAPTSGARATSTSAAVQPQVATSTPTTAVVNPQPTATPTAVSGRTMPTKVYLITLNGATPNNSVGCGDAATAVTRQIGQTSAILTATMSDLLSIHDRNYGQSGLYNALYQSRLSVESVTLVNGKATIKLTGTMTLGGECDNPRVKAQLMQTALQFPTVKEAAIFINNIPLDQALSLK